ncbi:tyrosine-type recombinase/integrase [Bacteroides faecis]|jgi:integrase|uniref:tyrosine-type recombinase/integrase n=1 Tax=Bacteroides faecis TaxID=674529 RepID=UPI001C8C013F|nr:phage integrase SAM-like domain-containing protein [Bacteroides faecis]DAK86703.1 MAG TPA: Integrase [Caudoviricetes sp.]
MATVSWVVFKHHKKSDNTYNPKIRISHNRTSSYISTSIYTELVRFKRNSASGTITSEKIKEELDGLVREYRQIINEHQDVVNECETSKDIVAMIERRKQRKEIDFIEFARMFIEKTPNEGTKTVKTTGINSLCHFLNHKNGNEKLLIKDLTSRFLREYEAWLRQERYITVRQNKTAKQAYKTIKKSALNDTGIHSYMGIIQSVFNAALLHFNDYEKGDIIITNDPFKVYTIPAVLEAKKRAVDVDIIRKIYNYSPINKRKRTTMFTRDIYILSFLLAGMNAVDMLNCRMVNGRIEYERQKTKDRRKDNAFISVYVHPLALPIINKYRDLSGKNLFDFYKRYSNVRNLTKGIHRGMRSLCEELGIDYIQFYSARHSFATIARNECDISKDDISLCLNHSSGKTVTDTYIKQDFLRIDKVINKVVEYVFKIAEESK